MYKKEIAARHPRSKEFLYAFSRQHPEVLREYRDWLTRMERDGVTQELDEQDERLIAGALAHALRAIAPGDAQASEYHGLMTGVSEFIFFPSLVHPKKEHEINQGRKRIDILFENGATQGIFFNLPVVRHLPCAYVPFECKNYRTEVANPELDQLAGRFSVNRGKLGFLCCRNFQNRARFIESCRDTLRDDRGLILPLDDETVQRLLTHIELGQRREIENAVSQLVAEVWAG